MKDGNDNVVVTVPDLICILDLDSGEPLTNAETAAGQNVAVVGIPAPKTGGRSLRDSPAGSTFWRRLATMEGI